MRVLFVLEHFYPYIGGAETLFWELATNLTRAGHAVHVVTSRFRPDLPLVEDIDGLRIHRVKSRNRYLFTLMSMPAIWSVSRKCDLIQTTSYNAAFPAWLIGRLRAIPVVVTFHEVWGRLWFSLPWIPRPFKLAYFLWEAALLKLSFANFIAVSDATRKSLIKAGIPPKKVVLIYNAVNPERLPAVHPVPPEVFTFTYFGRLGPSKGLDLLIPAASRFLDDYPDSRFTLIIPRIPATLYKAVMSLMGEDRWEGRLSILHDLPVVELFQVVVDSSCVVIPSYSEGFCFAAAEAVVLDVPVVSSERAALPEVVSGRYLPIEPFSIEGVYQALVLARQDRWCHRQGKTFSMESFLNGYLDVYGAVCPK